MYKMSSKESSVFGYFSLTEDDDYHICSIEIKDRECETKFTAKIRKELLVAGVGKAKNAVTQPYFNPLKKRNLTLTLG